LHLDRCGLGWHLSGPEDGKIASLRNLYEKLFVPALGFKVLLELYPKLAYGCTYDIVIARIVIFRPTEHADPNRVLIEFARPTR
jgi:hypothetical protein